MNTSQSNKELTISRVFDAPRDIVFKAWIDPLQLAKWWGPKGFTNPVCNIDVRPGGTINIDMKAPDGIVYPMSGFFNEIIEPEKLVFTSIPLDKDGNALFEVLNTITFSEKDGKTTITMLAQVSKITDEAAPYLAGMNEGWNQSIDRLDELVATIYAAPLVFEKVYPAPMAMIWKALTDATEMKKWYFDIPEFKPEPGLEFQFLAGEKGKEFLHLCKVTQVIDGKKIAYTWRYDGYEGNSEVSFELFAEGDQTRLKLTHSGLHTFPPIPDFAKKNFVGGWTYFMNEGLPKYINS